MTWGSRARGVGAGVVAATSSGCFASAGPTIGYSLHDQRPTVGWEASIETFAVGQSYELGPDSGESAEPSERRVRVTERTYLVWEPRYGVALDDTWLALSYGASAGQPDPIRLFGAGATIGMRWDELNTPDARTEFGAIAGFWLGGAYLSTDRGETCQNEQRTIVSVAIGLRGTEIYLTPKVGGYGAFMGCSSGQ